MAPPIVIMLCKSTIVNEYDISSVKILYVGGAPTSLKTIRQVKTRYIKCLPKYSIKNFVKVTESK